MRLREIFARKQVAYDMMCRYIAWFMMCRWQGIEATGNGDCDGACILEAASYIRSTRSTAGYNFAARLDGRKNRSSSPVFRFLLLQYGVHVCGG